MLSALIETRNDEEGLARTLASLVGAAVEGVLRDVVVCDRGSTDHTLLVAEHAGCVCLANARILAGIGRAKGDWLLMLRPGARLDGDWTEAVLHHVGQAVTPARFSRAGTGLLSRILPGRRTLADGLLITKRQALSLASRGFDAETLARRVSAMPLNARIHAAPNAGARR
jgi:glycosyltransferase involved in cell wall biosynthesis